MAPRPGRQRRACRPAPPGLRTGRRSVDGRGRGLGRRGAGACRPGDLASSSFSSWSSRESSCSRSSSSRITSICSRCIEPNIWTSMPMACWNWSNICCCIMLNWLTSGTSTESLTSGWSRPGAAGVGGDELDAGGRGDDGVRRGGIGISDPAKAGRRGQPAAGRPAGEAAEQPAARASRRTSRGPGRGPGPGFPAADLHAIPPDPQHVAVGQGAEAHRVGVDADAAAPPQVDDPQPRRGAEQAGMERRDARVGQPELAPLGRPDQGHHPVHRPDRRLRRAVEEFQGDLGQGLAAEGPHGQGRFPARLARAEVAGRGVAAGPADHERPDLQQAPAAPASPTSASRSRRTSRCGSPGRPRTPARRPPGCRRAAG